MFALALRLHKTVAEIQALPAEELTDWLAYFTIEEEDKASEQFEKMMTGGRNG